MVYGKLSGIIAFCSISFFCMEYLSHSTSVLVQTVCQNGTKCELRNYSTYNYMLTTLKPTFFKICNICSNIQCLTFFDSKHLGPVTRKHLGDIMKPTSFFEDGATHARDQAFVQILLVSTVHAPKLMIN